MSDIKYCPKCGEKAYIYRPTCRKTKESFFTYKQWSCYQWECLKCKHKSYEICERTI